MKTTNLAKKYWKPCIDCNGEGNILRGPSKKRRRRYRKNQELYTKGLIPNPPAPLDSNMDICPSCSATGLSQSNGITPINPSYPTLAIIGAGIGGVALAVACIHRGIPFNLYEKDKSAKERSQGYGLTLQQASKAISGLGIEHLENGIISTRHIVFSDKGKEIGEWGLRKWKGNEIPENSKRKNIHIAREFLRRQLLDQIPKTKKIYWGHTLDKISPRDDGTQELVFSYTSGNTVKAEADLVIAADGIYSSVRRGINSLDSSPLDYLGCMVVLGICPISKINKEEKNLLDSATVFQVVNGHERIYAMPYDRERIMWQFSVPIHENIARELNKKGPTEMKKDILNRISTWETPLVEIISKTETQNITGYPVYDRPPLDPQELQKIGNVTMIGDAAHPMSPFKGQGANQAILDALALARSITRELGQDNWTKKTLREKILNNFEREMITRTSPKSRASREASFILHSEAVLNKTDQPRGRSILPL